MEGRTCDTIALNEYLFAQLGRHRRLSVGLRRRSSSAAFCHIKDVRCETNLQQLWRQVFCSCRSEAVKQPFNWYMTSWH